MNQLSKLKNGNSIYPNNQIFISLNSNSKRLNNGNLTTYPTNILPSFINEILNSLPQEIQNGILALMEQVQLETGKYLYQPEEEINYLYFPETAIISDFQILEDGKTLEIAMIGKDGVAGITSIFNSHLSPTWLQVSIPGTAFRINSETFHQQFKRFQPLQELIFDYLNHYIAQISQKVICNSHHSVEERLCCWLLMISDRSGRSKLPLTQEQIAGFLGVHRPSVTLITQSLREKGIIDYLRGKIFITDKVKLEFNSCGCYSTTKIM